MPRKKPTRKRPRPGIPALSRGWSERLRQRLNAVCKGLTYRDIGRRTGSHPETIRRYLCFGSANPEFIAAVSLAFGVSTDWLLHGKRIGRGGIPAAREHHSTIARVRRDLERAGEALTRARAALGDARRR